VSRTFPDFAVRYLVVDEDGQLWQRSAASYDVALRDVGPEGWDRVRLHNTAALCGPGRDVAAFLNDCGLVLPARYGRNVVGTCLLTSLGAGVQPYAGPIVLTGWNPLPDGDAEVEGLTEQQVGVIRRVHGEIRVVLGLAPGTPNPSPAHQRWRAAMRETAEIARTGPTPGVTMLTDDDALAFMMRGGGRRG